MIPSYRLVHYAPDPLSGVRFPLGALVVDRGRIISVPSPRRPDAGCLGGARHARLFHHLCNSLLQVDSFDALPVQFGPQVTLGDRLAVPDGVHNPGDWVARFVLPQSVPKAESHSGGREVRRSSYGYSFLRNHNVAQWVNKTFKPRSDLDGWLAERSAGLHEVSHWVKGDNELLLMEPIVPSRQQVTDDVHEVAARFAAYRWALEDAPKTHRRGVLVAYVLSGGSVPEREAILDDLRGVAHSVVDTRDEEHRKDFLERVRAVGASDHEGRLDFQGAESASE